MGCKYLLAIILLVTNRPVAVLTNEFGVAQCEPIRIKMCRNLGYNETSMPNLAGNEMQSEAEYTLQSFSPLIEYVCSSQLKLFLCATYVPMCTPKAPVPIGPCRTLCENVRSRCDPVLQGFGYLWPPALDCSHFPKENNQETMCMEGPGEAQEMPPAGDAHPVLPAAKMPLPEGTLPPCTSFECPDAYVKLHRSCRCAPRCEANILFGPNEKRVAEIWTITWTYAALGLALLAILCLITAESKSGKTCEAKNVRVLKPLLWCHTMVVVGWTVRFIAGRIATSCGYDPQSPNVSLLLVDGLSNGPCAATFILRYYFGMAASAWWAILCLGWHRNVRRNCPDMLSPVTIGGVSYVAANSSSVAMKQPRGNIANSDNNITTSNLARFLAWGLPAFQTAAVIVARLVDADELLGACFVGNQSDKGLQILVATPLFCYWIFGSMNLASGFLVHRRNKEILKNTNSNSMRLLVQNNSCISGSFLFIYCLPCALLLLAVIYEFANIDVWLNVSPYVTSIKNSTIFSSETPMWPFLTRAFMELMLAIICSSWVLGPKISYIYKNKLSKSDIKTGPVSVQSLSMHQSAPSHDSIARTPNKAYSAVSYQSVRHPKNMSTHAKHLPSSVITMNHTNYSPGHSTSLLKHPVHMYKNQANKNGFNSFHRYGDETIL